MAETPPVDPVTEQNAFLTAIGHICLQWALLEQTLLFIIGAIENLPMQKAYKVFAGLDMGQRMNMAVQLAQDARLPHLRFIRPLIEIKKNLNREGGGLANRRNMFVHGVHKFGSQRGEYVLTMTRWKGDKQSQTVTLADAVQLVQEIAVQVQKADRIFCDYGVWKFGPEYHGDSDEKVAKAKASLRAVRAHQIKRAFKLLFANLKPW